MSIVSVEVDIDLEDVLDDVLALADREDLYEALRHRGVALDELLLTKQHLNALLQALAPIVWDSRDPDLLQAYELLKHRRYNEELPQ